MLVRGRIVRERTALAAADTIAGPVGAQSTAGERGEA
jgi:hypothetical protein